MTIQEVRALIDAKIKGQGTNVDAGSVLPIILNGILDLINEGGGGTSDAVQYIPQELTAPQQMQARKNQGLYYEEEGIEEKTASWDGVTPSGSFDTKLSDDTPSVEDIVALTVSGNSVQYDIFEQDYGYILQDTAEATYLFVIVLDATLSNGQFAANGIYSDERTQGVAELVYNGPTTVVHQIPAKYIPDMPSGGIENFTLLSLPTNYAMNVAKTTFFASEDWEEINGLEVFTASYNKGQAGERDFLVINDGTNLTFYGQYGVEFILSPYYVEGYVSGYPINGGQIQLSGLPNASMTSAELEALGFGALGGNFSYWSSHCFNIVKINDLFAQQLFGIIALTSNYLEFWDATNKYVITVSLGQLSCTVTPR